jgi:hypothetical protein
MEINYEELEEWLIPQLPSLLSNPNSDDADIIADIELCLAELSDGIINELEFRHNIQDELLKHQTILFDERKENGLLVIYGTVNPTFIKELEFAS